MRPNSARRFSYLINTFESTKISSTQKSSPTSCTNHHSLDTPLDQVDYPGSDVAMVKRKVAALEKIDADLCVFAKFLILTLGG